MTFVRLDTINNPNSTSPSQSVHSTPSKPGPSHAQFPFGTDMYVLRHLSTHYSDDIWSSTDAAGGELDGIQPIRLPPKNVQIPAFGKHADLYGPLDLKRLSPGMGHSQG
jgi:hypothetical protein